MTESSRFVIITGLSGAGKSQALRFLEDLGYYCVDNLPAPLIPTFAELVMGTGLPKRLIAVSVDARSGEDLVNLPGYVDTAAELGIRPDTLFLDSADEVLLQRYSETRRRHPAAPNGPVEEGIRRERVLLEGIRARADLVVDTSATSVKDLYERLATMFHGSQKPQGLVITVLSFGFKHGLPPEADLVFDVRFLPNPFYDAELRLLTGLDPAVADYVLDNPDGKEFMERLRSLLKFLIPRYAAEPKSYLTIGVGCTGGRHRSVAVAQGLVRFLRDLNYDAQLRHRNLTWSESGLD